MAQEKRIAWADAWDDHRCRPIAMRDSDIGWTTKNRPMSELTES
jgi:hypothetical protein